MYSVVIPVFNSSGSLLELTNRLAVVFKDTVGASYEIVFVDDGSTNIETWETLEKIVAAWPLVSAIRLTKNFGKPNALLCGLAHAQGKWHITMDDDLQHLPEDIPFLLQQKSHDVVVGKFEKKSHRRAQVLTSWLKRKFEQRILKTTANFSPFKLINSEITRAMLQVYSPSPFISSLLTQVTRDVVNVPVTHGRSLVKSSRYGIFSRLKQFSNLMIGNSSFLLRVLGMIGVATALAGFVFAGKIFFDVLVGAVGVSGWASLMTINLVYGGLLLIAFSIVGEYLIRILEATSKKQTYIMRSVIKGSEVDK